MSLTANYCTGVHREQWGEHGECLLLIESPRRGFRQYWTVFESSPNIAGPKVAANLTSPSEIVPS